MKPSVRLFAGAALALALAAPASSALAWGAWGHRMVGVVAAESFPSDLPAFLRTPDAVAAIGEYAREPDRWKGSGKVHDTDRDAAHFLDIDDEGKMYGGPKFTLETLPPTRADYEKALAAVGHDSWNAGYLPYSIIDGYQQLVKDFTYWRILQAVSTTEKDATRKAYYVADLKRREELLVRDLGVWAHYVGDASQPLHLSVHYNGWGDYPNPNGYTQSRATHGNFEGPLVKAVADRRRRQGPGAGLQGLRLHDRGPDRDLSQHDGQLRRAAVQAGEGGRIGRCRSARQGVRRRTAGGGSDPAARHGRRRLEGQRHGQDRLPSGDHRR
jgi:hypothetical protein